MVMTYDGALVMPSSYAVMEQEEMTYVEGGGTVRVTVKKSTIQNLISVISGAVTGTAVALALDSLGIKIAAAIELGTAGTATLAVGAFLVAWNGWAVGIASSIAGSVVGSGVGKLYKGGDKTMSVTNSLLPNFNYTI